MVVVDRQGKKELEKEKGLPTLFDFTSFFGTIGNFGTQIKSGDFSFFGDFFCTIGFSLTQKFKRLEAQIFSLTSSRLVATVVFGKKLWLVSVWGSLLIRYN